MKIAYLNGEKVYVVGEERDRLLYGLAGNEIRILKHRDFVNFLNGVLEGAEDYTTLNVFLSMVKHSMWSEAKNGAVCFDDPQRIKRAKQAKLKQEIRVTVDKTLKLVGGSSGLATAPAVDAVLSEEFLAFRRTQRR